MTVAVDHGVATLTGTVATRTERRYAVMDAYEAGAKEVVSHLAITHGAPLADGS